jgi:hypothetical protein
VLTQLEKERRLMIFYNGEYVEERRLMTFYNGEYVIMPEYTKSK